MGPGVSQCLASCLAVQSAACAITTGGAATSASCVLCHDVLQPISFQIRCMMVMRAALWLWHKESPWQLVDLCAGDSRSAEMRYESAWRMGQWQRGTDQSSTLPGCPVGTNEAVLGCLRVSVRLTNLAA